MAYIYCHYKIGSRPKIFYIGVGGLNKFDNYRRAKTIKKRSNLWRFMSYKVDWSWEILEDNLTKEQALLKEKEWISIYGRYDIKTGILSNMTEGGEGGCGSIALKGRKRDPEIARKAKETLLKKGGYKHADKIKVKISENVKGKNNPFYGKRHSDSSLEKMSKMVINLETGIFYISVKEACKSTNYKYGNFKSMLNNRRYNKTNFKQI